MSINKKSIDLARLYLEYKNNPIKFIEECCYLPEAGKDRLAKLYEPQKKIVRDFYNGTHDMILLKSRQIGLSTLWQMISVHLCVFYENVVIGVTSKSESEASSFCRKTYDIIDKLPEWIHPGYKWKSIQKFCTMKGSQLQSSAISITNPGTLFRGSSITLLIMDEIAHVPSAEKAWTGVAASLSIAHKRAEQNGIPYGTVLLSTPNRATGIGKFFFDMWKGANEQTNNFIPYRIHWKEVDELRNDPNWYKRQCMIYNNDSRKISQELELKFVGDSDTLFSEDVQVKLQMIIDPPKRVMRLAVGGELRIFEEPVKNKFYLIGVDTASSYGKDSSAVQVVDYKTMNQVMEYQGKLEPKAFADVVRTIHKITPNNMIIVENTGGYGIAVLNELQYDDSENYNLFEEYKDNNLEKEPKIGLSTNVKTRPLIIQSLYEMVVEHTELIKSTYLVNELLSLVDKGGKVQADEGTHDDLCMSYGFCCYVRKFYHENILLVEKVESESIADENINIIADLNGFGSIDNTQLARNPDKFKSDLDKYIRRQIELNRNIDPVELIWGKDSIFFG